MKCEHHAKTKGDGTWEEIVAPFACSYYAIDPGAQTFDKCCNPEDPSTFVTGLRNHSVTAPPLGLVGQRWDGGEVITYVRSGSPLNVYILR